MEEYQGKVVDEGLAEETTCKKVCFYFSPGVLGPISEESEFAKYCKEGIEVAKETRQIERATEKEDIPVEYEGTKENETESDIDKKAREVCSLMTDKEGDYEQCFTEIKERFEIEQKAVNVCSLLTGQEEEQGKEFEYCKLEIKDQIKQKLT